jgi:spermidine/putrescine transport system substrate-binding protein
MGGNVRHPKERPSPWALSRRDFLLRTGGAAAALTGAGSLLSACADETNPTSAPTDSSGQLLGPGGIPLPRPDNPVTLPIYDDNPPIEDGMEPESGGEFIVYNYPDYLWKKILRDFGEEYGVDVKYASFNSMDEAVRKLSQGAVKADVMFPTTDRVSALVAGKLLMPINKSYIPNLAANVWDSLQSPFYDVNSQYTVPYTTYGTGIGYRNDKITEDIPSLSNPWDIIWESKAYKGKTAILDDSREGLVLGMYHNGEAQDVNTEDPAIVGKAGDALKELVDICNIKVNIDGYYTLAEGRSWLHHTWSGDMIANCIFYLPSPDVADLLSYWAPTDGSGPIGNDTIAVLAGTEKPVLAHLFLDYMLDQQVAYDNFVNFNGYQPPQKSLDPDTIVSDGLIPEALKTCVVTDENFKTGQQELALTAQGQALWQNEWSEFRTGA